MRKHMCELCSQIYLVEVVCRVHLRYQRTQMLMRIFKFVHKHGHSTGALFMAINFNPDRFTQLFFPKVSNVRSWPGYSHS